MNTDIQDMPQDIANSTTQLDSSASSVSEQNSEANDFDASEENITEKNNYNGRTVAATTMTDIPYNNREEPFEEACKITSPFYRNLQEYFK